jgi:hypothetical protein
MAGLVGQCMSLQGLAGMLKSTCSLVQNKAKIRLEDEKTKTIIPFLLRTPSVSFVSVPLFSSAIYCCALIHLVARKLLGLSMLDLVRDSTGYVA